MKSSDAIHEKKIETAENALYKSSLTRLVSRVCFAKRGAPARPRRDRNRGFIWSPRIGRSRIPICRGAAAA